MKITFLGTGTSTGVPMIGCDCETCLSTDERDQRLRCSIMVEINDHTLVVDTTPDFRQQMLSNQVKEVNAILMTHQHKDHTGGLDDIRPFNFFQDIDMPIYATEGVQKTLRKQYDYIFEASKYPGIPRLIFHTITKEAFEVAGIPIIPIEVLHHKLPVMGFRFGDFTYITDANYIAPAEKEKIKGSKVLVLNALRRKEHISHFTLAEAVALVEELKPERAFFTHLSHQMGLHEEIEKELADHIRLAYDGLVLEL